MRFNFDGVSKKTFTRDLQPEKHELHKASTDEGIVIVTKLEAKKASSSIVHSFESNSKETKSIQVLSEKHEFPRARKDEGMTMQSKALKQRTSEEPDRV
jgi:hypothetical protein